MAHFLVLVIAVAVISQSAILSLLSVDWHTEVVAKVVQTYLPLGLLAAAIRFIYFQREIG